MTRSNILVVILLLSLTIAACHRGPSAGGVLDEAQRAGREAASFPQASEDYFHDMDNGVALSGREVKGRNMWIVWTGGNDRFWDGMTATTFGAFDLLKIVAPGPGFTYNRDNRWEQLGLINEPCFDKAIAPDPDRFGLYLDVRRKDCPDDPFANEAEYPGVKIGARGTHFADGKVLPVGSYYGYPTGVVGLRLFPNPAFDAKAEKRWDPVRYYSDPSYYNDKTLVRPYRVGMSCGFCHVGPSPIHPPADPEKPQWADLNSTVGAQYMWVDRLFAYGRDPRNFMYQLVHTYRQGSMDTSLVSTDNINNPRTMNAVYNLPERLQIGEFLGKEALSGGGVNNKQFNSYVSDGWLTSLFTSPNRVATPHVLKDGSDSVGALGALNRVYLNIGLFSEEWLLHFNAVVGGKSISPIPIATAERNSAYWRATEAGTPDTALFFLKAAKPDRLSAAPGGSAYLNDDPTLVDHGKDVFADTCARCHSSKAPPGLHQLQSSACEGPGYLNCFHKYWSWTQTSDYKLQMRKIVHAPDFLDGNYLSTDLRIPATLLRTNACSPLATNAIRGNIWDNFSSETYKSLPSVGSITIQDPFTGERRHFHMPGGGRGYTRVPSLISLWSTAPYLLNNSVGPDSVTSGLYGASSAGDGGEYDHDLIDPSVPARMRVFNASIEQMLWPEKRNRDQLLPDKLLGKVDRTTRQSEIYIPYGYMPDALRPATGLLKGFFPGLVSRSADGQGNDLHLGPIPAGMPVNLLANFQMRAETTDPWQALVHWYRILTLLGPMDQDLKSMPAHPTDVELRDHFDNVREPLLALSKCPDYVVNRGHLFGSAFFNRQYSLTADERSWGKEPVLTDDDKRALIAFLKTF
jgi:hypothetical protein